MNHEINFGKLFKLKKIKVLNELVKKWKKRGKGHLITCNQ
jgi:hypothetical protein